MDHYATSGGSNNAVPLTGHQSRTGSAWSSAPPPSGRQGSTGSVLSLSPDKIVIEDEGIENAPAAAAKMSRKRVGLIALAVVGAIALIGTVAGVVGGAGSEASTASTAAHVSIAKMVAEEAYAGKAFPPDLPAEVEAVETSSFLTMGSCTPAEPYEFLLAGGDGRGAVAVSSESAFLGMAFVSGTEPGTLDVGTSLGSANVFSFGGEAVGDTFGWPFEFESVSTDGAMVQVTCDTATSVIILVTDDSGIDLAAEVTVTSSGGSGGSGTSETLQLTSGATAETVYGESLSDDISFDVQGLDSVVITHGQGGGVAMVQLQSRDGSGNLVGRTFVYTPREAPETPAVAAIAGTDLDEYNDLVITLNAVGSGDSHVKLQARLSVLVDGQTHECVDIAAFVNDFTLTVHNEWFGQCLEDLNLTTSDEWEVVVSDAVVSDPEDAYKVLSRLSSPTNLGSRLRRRLSRHLATRGPVDRSESSELYMEMRQGRKPQSFIDRQAGHSRRLQVAGGGHKKILVHGYCAASNPFPTSQFSNEVEFIDPANPGAQQNFRHDEFAQKIDLFANNQGLEGCGCIGHSQGGMACLHLYTFYWSCLDGADRGGSRLIQSVGSPYSGTPLAGSIAALGDVFGAGCGSNPDMTTSGGASWLNTIPSSSRSKLTYFTTQFNDNGGWWSNDYCNFFADLVLSDPEDGTTERSRGQVSGANNGGHKKGWCHTTGMRDPAQTTDSSRNNNMNNNANY